VLLEMLRSGVYLCTACGGADRTGAVIAAYRIDHDHWDNSRALKEAMEFGMGFFQVQRQKFIRKFQPLPSMEAPKVQKLTVSVVNILKVATKCG